VSHSPVRVFPFRTSISRLTKAGQNDSFRRLFGWKSGGLGRRAEMAVYTMLDKRELADIIEDYGLVRLISASGISTGSVNTNYLLETARGKHLVRVDEGKRERAGESGRHLLLFL